MGNNNAEDTTKYFLVVVEGPTDRTTFENALRLLIANRFSNKDLEIDVVRGDTLTMDEKGKIIQYNKEEETVSKQIGKAIKKLHLKESDIVAIAMVTDLDACFAEDSFYEEDENHKKAFYDEESNKCLRINISELKTIRQSKFNVVRAMHNKNYISINGKQIKYRLFYLNVDLEWAFYRLLNCIKIQKIDLSNDFDTRYGDNIEEFERFIESLPSIGGNYEESWEPIVKRTLAPLERITNIRYLIEWIKSFE